MATQALTMEEFRGDDFAVAEKMARKLGYTQTAYISTSALWGLFCLANHPAHKPGCIIKTQELGFLFVQDSTDLRIE